MTEMKMAHVIHAVAEAELQMLREECGERVMKLLLTMLRFNTYLYSNLTGDGYTEDIFAAKARTAISDVLVDLHEEGHSGVDILEQMSCITDIALTAIMNMGMSSSGVKADELEKIRETLGFGASKAGPKIDTLKNLIRMMEQ